ncbi:hypothetical protein ACFQH6_18605 [Halobacteriaceae archaeon GCM10025711]
MRSHAALAIALVVLLVAAPGLADQTTAQQTAEPPGVVMEVAVFQNGDARWNVTTTVPIRNESDARAFDRLAEDFRSGEAGFSPDIFETVAESASDRTNRTMAIRDVDYETAVVNESGNRTGTLSLSFTWTNFANVSNETIAVGDAFGASGFDSLSANQRLLIRPPPGYGIDSVSPSTQITNGVARWDGPRTFDAGEPAITYEAQPSVLPLEPDPTLLAAGGAVAVVVLATAGYLLLRRRRPTGPAPTPAEDASSVEGDGGSEAATPGGAETAAEGAAPEGRRPASSRSRTARSNRPTTSTPNSSATRSASSACSGRTAAG